MSRPNVETLTIQDVKTSGYRDAYGNTQFQGIRFNYRGDVIQIRHIGIELTNGKVVSVTDIDLPWLRNAAQHNLARYVHRSQGRPGDSGLSLYYVNELSYRFAIRSDSLVSFTNAPLPWGMASGEGVLWDLRDNTRYEMPLSREDVHRLFGEPDHVELSSFHMK